MTLFLLLLLAGAIWYIFDLQKIIDEQDEQMLELNDELDYLSNKRNEKDDIENILFNIENGIDI